LKRNDTAERMYMYEHEPFRFDFAQTPERFFVEEIPLQKGGTKGRYALLKVRKRDMTTAQLVDVIARSAEIAPRDVGYAGLKDKHADTIQYLTIPRYALKRLHKGLKSERIALLETEASVKPLKPGMLKANRFRIVLHRLAPEEAGRLEKVFRHIAQEGFPNYFGFQRFGRNKENWKEGAKFALSGARIRTPQQRMRVAAYQSYLFNRWLARRVAISAALFAPTKEAERILRFLETPMRTLENQPHRFKLFLGDVLRRGAQLRHLDDLQASSEAFFARRISPTGLLCGTQAMRARGDARYLEAPFDDDALVSMRGDRRDAWVYADDIALRYDAAAQTATLHFTLPKGSYATTFIEEIKKKSLR
jgi:tRNA pseudouridine13 synthase